MPVINLTQLQDVFHGVTVTMTGLAAKAVRHAYQGQGQPAFEISQDCAFIHLTERDEEINRTRDTVVAPDNDDQGTETVHYTRVIQAQWTLYGPNAYNKGDEIRYQILTDAIRGILADSDLYPVPDIPAPARAPYLFNGQWWERADLFIRFNCGTTRTRTVPYIAVAAVEVHTDDGKQADFDIQP